MPGVGLHCGLSFGRFDTRAARLNGTDQYFSYTGATFDPGVNDFAPACCVRLSSAPTDIASIFSAGIITGGEQFWWLYLTAARVLTLRFNDGNAAYLTGTSGANTMDVGRWYTVMVNCDRSGNAVVYVNNSAWITLDISVRPNSVAPGKFALGRYSEAAFYFWPGLIDNAFFANRLLTSGERTWLQNNARWRKYSECGVAGTGGENLDDTVFEAFWEFEDPSDLGNDSTTNNVDLTPQNSPSIGYGIQ